MPRDRGHLFGRDPHGQHVVIEEDWRGDEEWARTDQMARDRMAAALGRGETVIVDDTGSSRRRA